MEFIGIGRHRFIGETNINLLQRKLGCNMRIGKRLGFGKTLIQLSEPFPANVGVGGFEKDQALKLLDVLQTLICDCGAIEFELTNFR